MVSSEYEYGKPRGKELSKRKGRLLGVILGDVDEMSL
jgi:hypothetical protein